MYMISKMRRQIDKSTLEWKKEHSAKRRNGVNNNVLGMENCLCVYVCVCECVKKNDNDDKNGSRAKRATNLASIFMHMFINMRASICLYGLHFSFSLSLSCKITCYLLCEHTYFCWISKDVHIFWSIWMAINSP